MRPGRRIGGSRNWWGFLPDVHGDPITVGTRSGQEEIELQEIRAHQQNEQAALQQIVLKHRNQPERERGKPAENVQQDLLEYSYDSNPSSIDLKPHGSNKAICDTQSGSETSDSVVSRSQHNNPRHSTPNEQLSEPESDVPSNLYNELCDALAPFRNKFK